jgi:L-aminopeptidase/D-esterase-like protein
LVRKIHGLLFAGGSAFGLSAADGVIKLLEERDVGFPVGKLRVPVVPAAIIFDLNVGQSHVRPDASMGYSAAESAVGESEERGSVGAGIGATVGKVAGMDQCMRGGLGMASARTPGGAVVASLVVVNAFGDVCDDSGQIIAGARTPDGKSFLDSECYIAEKGLQAPDDGRNTTLCLVATDADVDRPGAHKLARLAVAGLYRTVRPAGTMLDGDMVFAVGMGKVREDLTVLGVTAVRLLARAVLDAVVNADPTPGIPSYSSLDEVPAG